MGICHTVEEFTEKAQKLTHRFDGDESMAHCVKIAATSSPLALKV